MVATKATTVPQNGKRRGGFHGGAPNRQRFKPGKQMNARNMGAMFTANQLGDNPGFLDFNEDVQIPPTPVASSTTQVAPATAADSNADAAATTSDGKGGKGGPNRKAGGPNQKRFRNGNNMRRMPPGMNGGPWGPPIPPMPPMFPMGGGGRRNGGPFGPPPPHFRVPPMGMRDMWRPGPMPMMPPRPMMPMPPMRGGPMNWGPNSWNRPDGGPPMRRNPNGKLPPGGGRPGKGGPKGALRNGTGKGPKPSPGKKGAKAREPARPREEYPLDQPWVTDEIKAEHDKKVQLADRLKGNKDDALFAQFKEQRDKFVKMYDAAKLEFIGKHPEQDVDKIITESEPTTATNATTAVSKPETETRNTNSDAVSTETSAAAASTTTATTTSATAAADASASSTSG